MQFSIQLNYCAVVLEILVGMHASVADWGMGIKTPLSSNSPKYMQDKLQLTTLNIQIQGYVGCVTLSNKIACIRKQYKLCPRAYNINYWYWKAWKANLKEEQMQNLYCNKYAVLHPADLLYTISCTGNTGWHATDWGLGGQNPLSSPKYMHFTLLSGPPLSFILRWTHTPFQITLIQSCLNFLSPPVSLFTSIQWYEIFDKNIWHY